MPQGGWAALAGGDTATPHAPALRRVRLGVVDGLSLTALTLVLGLVAFVRLNRPLKDDVAWLLYVAEQVLDGRELYVDLVEINPPLIVLLSAVPAGLARALDLPLIPVFLAIVALVLLVCAWLTARLLQRYSSLFRSPVRTFAIIASMLFLIPGPEYGQREHLLIALVLPYLALLALRLRGDGPAPSTAAAVTIGLLAGIGVALKPYHLLTFALVELLALARGLRPPWRRAETIGAGLLLASYTALVAALFPAYLAAIVPLARDLYGASNDAPASVFFKGWHLLVPLTVLVPLVLADIGRSSREPLALVLLVFGYGAFLAYLAQQKGWFYHRLPGETALLLLLVYWIARTVCEKGTHTGRLVRASVGVVACLLGTLGAAALDRLGHDLAIALHPEATIEYRLAELIRRNGAESLLALSQDLSPAFPAVNMIGVRWTSRFDTMWVLRGVIWRQICCGSDSPPARSWPVRRWLVDDFLAGRPDIVLVDDRQGIDYLAELAVDPHFAAAWGAYRLTASIDGRRVFEAARLWLRTVSEENY